MNNQQRFQLRCSRMANIDKRNVFLYPIYGRIYEVRYKLWRTWTAREEKWEGFENFKMEV